MGNEGSSQSQAQSEPIPNTVNIDWDLRDPDQNDDLCSSRDGHTACAVGACVYVFGGVLGSSTNSMPVESNDLFEYNVDLKKWRKIDAKGEIPKPRSGSTMVSVENKLYLFGGLSQNVGWFDDLSVFNIETEIWNKITAATGAAPSPRDKLTSVAINKVLYFFGGFGPHAAGDDSSQDSQDEEWEDMEDQQPRGPSANFGWFDDVYSFDTEANKWELATPIKLHAPSPRAAHSMCSVGDKIIIFGGRDCEARRNDMFMLDTTEKKWLPINGQGSTPAPRSFHSMVAVGKRVVVFGGRSQSNQHFNDCHIFDTETIEWLQPTSKGSLPEARGSHTLTNVGETLVLFGGTSEFDTETMQCKKYHSDVCLLKTVDILSGAAIPKEEKEYEKAVDNIQSGKQPEFPTKTTEQKAEGDTPNGQEV
ncbi:rab9 effector protein with kelch motifs-like [Anneissia japonica]|uniref:rab9 effector protein with kelch motifs-like n=1 Tax=Anneissia japonica TaxID=1529436 RepID=UPI001425BA66|nr:rab9 effector protein with kelch motifs-like [Anneissia japonica]